MEAKDQALSAVAAAQNELSKAILYLEQLPAFDPGNVHLSAHALNNYLAVVSGIADLLKTKLLPSQDNSLASLLNSLSHASGIMRQTVQRLTHMSMDQPESFLSTRVDLVRLVRFAHAHYRKAAEQKEISIALGAIPEEAYGKGDGVAAAAVLDNLISNALKYSPGNTAVRLSVEASDNGRYWVCSVADQGPGIAEEDLSLLFQKGRRLGHTPTGGEPSTGYGLAVAKELVEQMGGTIRCESRVGSGSTFSFTVPVYEESPESEA